MQTRLAPSVRDGGAFWINSKNITILVEKPASAGGAPLGGRLKLCEGDSRIHRI